MNSVVLDRRTGVWISDQWAYVALCGLFFTVALTGFMPRSIAILEGTRVNPPLVVHLHAATMALWLSLLLTQSILVATGRRTLHRTLGLASIALAVAVVVTLFFVMTWRYGNRVQLGQASQGANMLMAQSRTILYFSVFYIWALASRRRDTQTHKRMLVLATVVALPAALSRMAFLPTTMPDSYASLNLFMLLLLVPALLWDVQRLGRPHRAYLLGLALLLPWMIAMHFLWNSPWWLATAPKLMALLP